MLYYPGPGVLVPLLMKLPVVTLPAIVTPLFPNPPCRLYDPGPGRFPFIVYSALPLFEILHRHIKLVFNMASLRKCRRFVNCFPVVLAGSRSFFVRHALSYSIILNLLRKLISYVIQLFRNSNTGMNDFLRSLQL